MIRQLGSLRMLILCVACSGLLAPGVCSAAFEVIATYNDPSPDGNGNLATFTQPALSDSGDVAFLSLLLNTANDEFDNIALYRGNGSGLTLIARKGVTTLDGELVTSFINNSPSIHGTSVAHMADRAADPGRYVALRGNGGTIDSFLSVGSSSPAGNNELVSNSIPVYNVANTATYRAFYSGANPETGIYTRTADGTIATLLREFDVLPHEPEDPTVTVLSLDMSYPTINSSGHVAVAATVEEGFFLRKSVLLVNGSSTLEVAHDASQLADGMTSISNILSNAIPINDSGQMAFTATYTQPAIAARRGVFLASADSVTLITPNLLPGSSVVPSNLRLVNMNNAGEVAFTTEFGSSGDTTGGIYVADAQGTDLIALEDTATPSGSTFFRRLIPETISLNEQGQLAFVAELSNTANGSLAGRALFRYDPTGGLEQIVRTGDAFAGSTIAGLGFTGAAYTMTQTGDVNQSPDASFSGLNNSGQLAFNFSLANGQSGIAIWSADSASLQGDYNGNGTVDAADYTLWRDHLGETFTLANENPTASTPGIVDMEDYDFWKSNFGASAAGGGSASVASNAVPEPSISLVLLHVGAAIATTVARRRT